MKFAKHTFLGHADGKAKMIAGTKLSTDGPRKFTPPEKPQTFTSLPLDAKNVKWECVGTGVRARYRKGWLVSRANGTFHYIPDLPAFAAAKNADNLKWEKFGSVQRARLQGGWLIKTNSGSITHVPDEAN